MTENVMLSYITRARNEKLLLGNTNYGNEATLKYNQFHDFNDQP